MPVDTKRRFSAKKCARLGGGLRFKGSVKTTPPSPVSSPPRSFGCGSARTMLGGSLPTRTIRSRLGAVGHDRPQLPQSLALGVGIQRITGCRSGMPADSSAIVGRSRVSPHWAGRRSFLDLWLGSHRTPHAGCESLPDGIGCKCGQGLGASVIVSCSISTGRLPLRNCEPSPRRLFASTRAASACANKVSVSVGASGSWRRFLLSGRLVEVCQTAATSRCRILVVSFLLPTFVYSVPAATPYQQQ